MVRHFSLPYRSLLAAMALLAGPASASPPPVPMAQPDSRPDAICPSPQDGSAALSADALVEQAEAALAADEAQRAESLLRSAVDAGGHDLDRARALRMLIDLRAAGGDMAEIERILACGARQGEAWDHARAVLALRQGRPQDAVDELIGHVLPRHHMSRRWPIVHETLGDAYAKLGRRGDAQAQWRIALATEYGPSGTGWDRAALEQKLAAAMAAGGGSEPLLPLIRYHDAVSILDMASVERSDEGMRYSKLVLLFKDERGSSYGIDTYEVDCDEDRSRVLRIEGFDPEGEQTRLIDTPTDWRPDLPGEPWLPTERKLVCAIDPDLPVAPKTLPYPEMLRDYRLGGSGFPTRQEGSAWHKRLEEESGRNG